MIRAIIIEDSTLAQAELVNQLSSISNIEIIGQAYDGATAIQLIKDLQPHLLFLDIDLPDMTGFEMLNELDVLPQIIFTTAYDEYALKSFEVNPVDYLLKPIKKERLVQAVEKISIQKQEAGKTWSLQHSIFIKDGDFCDIVRLEHVQLFHTEGNYTKVHYQNRSPLLHKALSAIEARLDPDFFFRINRQEIININHIIKADKWFKGKLKLKLNNGIEVEVSERQSVKLKQQLSF